MRKKSEREAGRETERGRINAESNRDKGQGERRQKLVEKQQE